MDGLENSLSKLLTVLTSNFYLDDNKTKLLKYFSRIYHFSDEIKLFHYSGVTGSIKHISDGTDQEVIASGFSLKSEEEALLKFIGESIERFSQRVYREKDFLSSSYNQIEKNALNIQNIATVSTTQRKNPFFKKFTFDKNTVFNWILGKELSNGKDIYLPAQIMYLSYIYTHLDECIIYPSSTNGAAGGTSLESAILRGIFEIVERDHFLVTYLNKLSLTKVDLDSVEDATIIDLLELIYRHRFKITLIDLTLDLDIPTYLTIIIDETGVGPAISLGLKSNFDKKTAIIGSITEAFHPRCWIRRIVEDHPRLLKKVDVNNILSLRDRALYWYPVEKIKDIKFLMQGRAKKITKLSRSQLNYGECLEKVIKTFSDHNMKIYYKDITVPRFKDVGYYAVKVLIPEMVPFYLDERVPCLGAQRLYEVPVKLGYKKEIEELSLNKIPHPFL